MVLQGALWAPVLAYLPFGLEKHSWVLGSLSELGTRVCSEGKSLSRAEKFRNRIKLTAHVHDTHPRHKISTSVHQNTPNSGCCHTEFYLLLCI